MSICPTHRKKIFPYVFKDKAKEKGSSKERSAIAVQNVAIQPESEEIRGFSECSLECRAGICELGRLPRLQEAAEISNQSSNHSSRQKSHAYDSHVKLWHEQNSGNKLPPLNVIQTGGRKRKESELSTV